MRKLTSILACLLLVVPAFSQTATTLTISNTPLMTGIHRIGLNLDEPAEFGQQQILKSLNYVNGGFMPSTYWRVSSACLTGGTNDTTHWYMAAIGGSVGYPPNFWVGATYTAYSAEIPGILGTGLVTASTGNISTGDQLTLGTPLSAVCNTSNATGPDFIIVDWAAAPASMTTPQDIFSTNICSGATFTTDLSPLSTNTTYTLRMPAGCTLQMGIDQGQLNSTNTNATLAGQRPGWININGTGYVATRQEKCPVSACTVSIGLARQGGGATYVSTTDTPTVNTSPGVGWQTFTNTFNGTETAAGGTLLYTFTCNTAPCQLDVLDVVEPSTLAGNTTPFRDSVVRTLQGMHLGSLRMMGGAWWGSDVPDGWATVGNRRWSNFVNQDAEAFQPGYGYDDFLQLCNLIGAEPFITLGNLATSTDVATMVTTLNTRGWTAIFKAKGQKIHLEMGNELWNSGTSGGQLWGGEGSIYGVVVANDVIAAKAASGYDSSVIDLVASGFFNSGYGSGTGSWAGVIAQTTTALGGKPDTLDSGPYQMGFIETFATSGADVSPTGDPWPSMFAQVSNFNTTQTSSASMKSNQTFAVANGMNQAVYEYNTATQQGTGSITQLQLNEIARSVGAAHAVIQNGILMQRDSRVPGPLNIFSWAGNANGYFAGSGLVFPGWGIIRAAQCGPGQLGSCTEVGAPQAIELGVVNAAMGTNSNLLTTSQSGTSTYSYAGGQSIIVANAAVLYVQCAAYGNGASSYTVLCWNSNPSVANTVNLSGITPTGTVTETLFGNLNTITDNNENFFPGAGSIGPVVVPPTSSPTSGSSYSIPPATVMALTFTNGGGVTSPAALSGKVTLNGKVVIN